eukprot:1178082-Prorocentrum_minimum.AAC.3
MTRTMTMMMMLLSGRTWTRSPRRPLPSGSSGRTRPCGWAGPPPRSPYPCTARQAGSPPCPSGTEYAAKIASRTIASAKGWREIWYDSRHVEAVGNACARGSCVMFPCPASECCRYPMHAHALVRAGQQIRHVHARPVMLSS